MSEPVIVLHPNYRNQRKLLPGLLADEAFTPVYAATQLPATTWPQLWQLLVGALCEQAALDLRELPEPSPETAAERLCCLLERPYLLILDEIDNLEQESCSAFLAALAQRLPQHSKLILIGRRWPSELIAQLPDKSFVACYPLSELAMLFDYRTTPSNSKLLEVYAHADGRVLVNGVEVTGWEGYLPRALFHFLVDRGMVTRDEIFQSFWAELNNREATNVFHVTKRKIHEILGFNLTVYQNGYYRIAPDIDLHYDSAIILDQIQQSEIAEIDEAIALLENALKLYRSDFLRSLNGNWVISRRAALRNQMAEAFGMLGKLYERAERHIRAINAYERAVSMQPYREDWAHQLMSLYASQRQAAQGLRVLERLERALLQQMGRARLDKRTQQLAAKLRRTR
ncbi:MAG: bacterial transcriptional activator domain-containing protein [Aggregatilineales bacterium]